MVAMLLVCVCVRMRMQDIAVQVDMLALVVAASNCNEFTVIDNLAGAQFQYKLGPGESAAHAVSVVDSSLWYDLAVSIRPCQAAGPTQFRTFRGRMETGDTLAPPIG